MKIGIERLQSRVQTGTAIYKMAEYYEDLGKLLDLTLQDFFNYVKKIPYIEDSENEIVSRPKYILSKTLPGADCKKKAVLIGAWLTAHGIPWRLVAISERPDRQIHHVFPQAFLLDKWKTIDATYPEYRLFSPKQYATKAEILPR